MAVTPDDVRRVAELARLQVSAGEAEALARELEGILEHVEALAEVEAGDEQRASEDGPGIGQGGLRPDEPGADALSGALEALAPGFRDGFFTVPRLASHDDGA